MIPDARLVDDMPEATCPRCKKEQPDFDGFGVLKCIHCDYCKHASITDGVCGFCGVPLPPPFQGAK